MVPTMSRDTGLLRLEEEVESVVDPCLRVMHMESANRARCIVRGTYRRTL